MLLSATLTLVSVEASGTPTQSPDAPGQGKGEKWSWRLPIPFPWGASLDHRLSPLKLLDLPLAFTQSDLLSPDDFVSRADDRGVRLQTEQLLELHRRQVLVPLFRIPQHRPPGAEPVPVAPTAADRYRQYRSPIALVIEGAQGAQLADPAAAGRFRSWEGGLTLQSGRGITHRYASVFYSPYQLLALRAIEALVQEMEGHRDNDGGVRFTLKPLYPAEIAGMDGCRRLALFLSAIDMHYLPRILLTIHHPTPWEQEDPLFSIVQRLSIFGLTAEALAATAEQLLAQAGFIDPLGTWYELVRQAHPDTWTELRGRARLAMDYRIAAEMLLRALDDLDRKDLSTAPPTRGRFVRAILDDRLRAEREDLDEALTDRGLSPQPALLLILEGKTEMLLMPRVLQEMYGGPVPRTLVEFVNMDTIDRDLDLLIRHVLAPRFGEDRGDVVHLNRPPTRVLIAVDPEKRFKTAADQEKQRSKLVRRLFETLELQHQTATALAEVDTLVEVTTWGSHPWEFANFTDRELAAGIMACVSLPHGVTQQTLFATIAVERAVHGRSPNIERVCAGWPQRVTKVALAEALWPRLRSKIRRGSPSGNFKLPAGRVGLRALQLAMGTHRRHVGLRINWARRILGLS